MKLGINSILVICIMNIFLRILGIKKKRRALAKALRTVKVQHLSNKEIFKIQLQWKKVNQKCPHTKKRNL